MADNTFELNVNKTIPDPPLGTGNLPLNAVSSLIASQTSASQSTPVISTSSATSEQSPPDIEKELEKQLAETPSISETPHKSSAKTVAIIIVAVLLIGGGAAGYFFFFKNANTADPSAKPNEAGPPTIANPFASEPTKETDSTSSETSTEPETETDTDVNPSGTDTPDGPPSISFPSVLPSDDTSALETTVDELKETSDAAANIMGTPAIEDAGSTETETDIPKKVQR